MGFLKEHGKRILRGQQKKSSEWERKKAGKLLEEFQDLAAPFILQRSIQEHFAGQLPPKEEFVVWVAPSVAQWDSAERVIRSRQTQDAKDSGNRLSILSVITRLRMAALHPLLANLVSHDKVHESLTNNKDDDEDIDGIIDEALSQKPLDISHNPISPLSTLKDSPILRVCRDLLVDLTNCGHKVLVFCPYRKPFEFLGSVLTSAKVNFCLIDGSTRQKELDGIIESFNNLINSVGPQVLLSTIRKGGIGLTLTGADRVILLGASWNPKDDDQAVHRAFRIGQSKPVKVYRLLVSGLIDEKVYGKQIQKGASIREVQTVTGGCLDRLFDDKELRQLLTLGSRSKCEILERFPEKITKSNLQCSLEGHTKVRGIIRHDLVFRTFSNRFGGGKGSRKRQLSSDEEEAGQARKFPRSSDEQPVPDLAQDH